MTEIRPAERRKERRYIVCDVACSIDGHDSHIVDISRSGIRMVLPAGMQLEDRPYCVTFEVPEDGGLTTYQVTGRMVRHTGICVVLTYEPPCPHWEALLLSLDTFEMTRLSAI